MMGACCFKSSFECGLRWESCRDFTRTQWLLPRWLFVLYRLIAFFYTWGFQIYFWLVHLRPDSYAFVTNWTYLLLALYVLVATGNLITDLVLDARGSPINEASTLALRYMVQWIFYDVLVMWSIIVAIVYWGFLFRQNADIVEWVDDISIHLLPAVFGVIELTITATPCLYKHIVYPITYGLMYLTFSLIYWATGSGVTYFFLNYGENPVYAIVAVVGLTVATFVMYTMVWALTKLRQCIAKKTNGCRCGRRAGYDIEGNPINRRVANSDQIEGNETHIF